MFLSKLYVVINADNEAHCNDKQVQNNSNKWISVFGAAEKYEVWQMKFLSPLRWIIEHYLKMTRHLMFIIQVLPGQIHGLYTVLTVASYV